MKLDICEHTFLVLCKNRDFCLLIFGQCIMIPVQNRNFALFCENTSQIYKKRWGSGMLHYWKQLEKQKCKLLLKQIANSYPTPTPICLFCSK